MDSRGRGRGACTHTHTHTYTEAARPSTNRRTAEARFTLKRSHRGSIVSRHDSPCNCSRVQHEHPSRLDLSLDISLAAQRSCSAPDFNSVGFSCMDGDGRWKGGDDEPRIFQGLGFLSPRLSLRNSVCWYI